MSLHFDSAGTCDVCGCDPCATPGFCSAARESDRKRTAEIHHLRRTKPKPNGHDATNELTDDALALRFSERHADSLRYIATKGMWFKWDGVRWYPEETHLAFDLARQSCRLDAQQYGNGKPPNSVYSAKTIAAVERMAKADRRQASTIEQWDADDLTLNAKEQ